MCYGAHACFVMTATVYCAGLSDWLDGYVAKRLKQESVLGSYLDPLADKAVIVSVIGALGWTGVLSGPVVAVLLSRDILLVGGTALHRCASAM